MPRVLLLLLALLAAPAPAAEPTLKVGAPAPPLAPTHWLREAATPADPAARVVVFWSSWAAPTRGVAPIVVNLHRRHAANVAFLGVDAWETDPAAARALLDDTPLGKAIRFPVADDHDGALARAWLDAAGHEALPCAFVLDAAGSVAWVGHPGDLERALGGTLFNVTPERALKADTLLREARLLYRRKQWEACVARCDEAFAADPTQGWRCARLWVGAVLHWKPREFVARAAEQGELWRDSPMALNELAWMMMVDPRAAKPPEMVPLAVKLGERAVDLSARADPAILDTLARARWLAGDRDAALALQREAVAAIELAAGPGLADPESLESVRATLAEMQQGRMPAGDPGPEPVGGPSGDFEVEE